MVLLAGSKNGTAKHSVYKKFFEDEYKIIQQYEEALKNSNSKANEIERAGENVPQWYAWTQENLNQAAEKIINDPKTLFYCASTCLDTEIAEGKVVALKMDDTQYMLGGFGLQPDSEYLSMFNHFLLKAFETGILHRLDRIWNAYLQPPIKIGITEPEPLGINNVMFPLSCLGAAIIISLVIAAVEKVVNKIKLMKSNPAGSGVLFVNRN